MEILIFEDTPENMDAAQEASLSYPEHHFEFETQPHIALDKLESGKVGGLVTDFFSPLEPKAEQLWQDYLRSLRIYFKYIDLKNPLRSQVDFMLSGELKEVN